jgi:hypothetical protein
MTRSTSQRNDCFISYRRATSAFVARSVFLDLRTHKINAFLDVEAIGQGDFREVIEVQIRERPYFLPIFSPLALKRCQEPGDLLRKEFETAVEADRRIVPIITTEFDRQEISECLPEFLAAKYLALNTLTLDHDNFDASMSKLRKRFLRPVEVPVSRIDPELARDAERLTEQAAEVSLSPIALQAQKHFERSFAAIAEKEPELVAREWDTGFDLLMRTKESQNLESDTDLMFLELQHRMQAENTEFQMISHLLKKRHDELKASISKMR